MKQILGKSNLYLPKIQGCQGRINAVFDSPEKTPILVLEKNTMTKIPMTKRSQAWHMSYNLSKRLSAPSSWTAVLERTAHHAVH